MASSVPTVSKTDDGSGHPLTSPAAADGADIPLPPSCKPDTSRCIKRGRTDGEQEQADRGRLDQQFGATSSCLGSREEKTRRSQLSAEQMCKAMAQRTGPHLLLLIALCSVLYSGILSLPYTSTSDDLMVPAKRNTDAIFTKNYRRILKQKAAKEYLNSLLKGKGKRSLEDPGTTS